MFIPSTFNSMEDYGNLLLMRLLLRFLSFLFHYFINEVRKTRKKLLNLQSQKCQLQDKSSGLCHHKKTVTSKSVLKLNSVAGGGFAISILAQ